MMEKNPCNVCGMLVTYRAIFQAASGLGSRGLVRRKERENSEPAGVTGLGCEEEEGSVPGIG